MSQPPRYTLLEDRGLLSVGGKDRATFLQGLVSNDIGKVGPKRAVYAALLTPQGKYLHDFFVVGLDDALLLDCERARLDDLKKRLSMFKLRADVTLDDRSGDFRVATLYGDGAGSVGGKDRATFLQGLVSNDIGKVGPKRAVYAALLTPQGKYLHDFFVVGLDDALLLDCERARLDDLKKRLSMFKLRADVTLDDRSGDFRVATLYGDGAGEALGLSGDAGSAAAFGGGIAFIDPRLEEAGGRAVLPVEGAGKTLEDAGLKATDAPEYDRLRLQLGLPDGSRDLVVEKSTLLESGFDELNGVDWDKGCYMGQELTARTKYRGLVKKRLVPVIFDGPPPAPETPVMLGEKEAGELRSSLPVDDGGIGLALLRLDSMAEADETDTALKAGAVTVTPAKPDWMAI